MKFFSHIKNIMINSEFSRNFCCIFTYNICSICVNHFAGDPYDIIAFKQ